jgi:N-6 DNA Methylase
MAEQSRDILSLLRQLNGYEALATLAVDGLGFQFADEPRSTAAWPAPLRGAVSDVRVVARHGEFLVTYIQLTGGVDRVLSLERQVATRVLQAEPHSLLVFSDTSHKLWHFVHVRYDEQAERRRQLRRFVVDLRDSRSAERLRTTAERIAKLTLSQDRVLTASEVQDRCDEAFRVSEISKGFLKQFTKVIDDLATGLLAANPSVLASEKAALAQARLLMDRLVFLYFIQRKRWLNGEEDYLYRRFQDCYRVGRDDDSFYRERLLPLFHALSHRDWERPRLDDGEHEALPFLNGGLFDLPLDYGTANPATDEQLRVPNQTLYQVFADFLEKYNFTVTEDSPLDVEVAVNPEVIGTIFETFVLTAENEPDTNAPDRRKATGSYYTPRVVVHFICRAVLRRYLEERTGINEQVVKQLIESDPAEELDDDGVARLQALVTTEQAGDLRHWAMNLKACDPAVGSGAFLVGLLQEMVKFVRLLDLRIGGRAAISRRNHAFGLKREIIENCLYGVDIQEQAARICELRMWLSLVVDYQWDESVTDLRQRVEGVDPLPNLTFKVRVGDALLDQLFGRDWDVTAQRHDELTSRIREVKRLYYGSRSPEGKRDLERQVLELELDQLERRLNDQRLTVGSTIPLSLAMSSAAERKRYEATRSKLGELDDVLLRLTAAKSDLSSARSASAEDSRRFDLIRKRLDVSFVWALDFAEVFDPERAVGDDRGRGFDIIVANPPFVTARSADKRERYRKRWPTSTYKKYHLLAPFTELSLAKLLRPRGQLGFIVSNAFATRDFGKPVVEQVLNRIELRNVVDCSGLMFPGHGTPTCILPGDALPADVQPSTPTLLCGTRPGMGQLRAEPEETALWRETTEGWEKSRFAGLHMVTAGWTAQQARRHPWSLDAGGADTKALLERDYSRLRSVLNDDIGYGTVVGSEPVFVLPPESLRLLTSADRNTRWFETGEDARDWSAEPKLAILSPYDHEWDLLDLKELEPGARSYLQHFQKHLASRIDFGSRTYEEVGRPYWGHHQVTGKKYSAGGAISYVFVSTHLHASVANQDLTLNRHCFVLSPQDVRQGPGLLALLNSSTALFWLKQVCFCKRHSENPETDDYYEFAGGKVEQLPVPAAMLKEAPIRRRAGALAERCAALGAEVPGFHPRKLFERPGEAYTDWYCGIRGYQRSQPSLKQDWVTARELEGAWHHAADEVRSRRLEMVALQEELDWLLYAAYGLLPEGDPAANLKGSSDPMPIDQLDRPYRLIQHEREIPAEWPALQQALWHARLAAIDGNAHVRQIEQPAYKRRWVEPFDDGDFLDAYEWWLREKAEWLLEREYGGGPVNLPSWAARLQDDSSVLAAYEAAITIDAQRPNPRYSARHAFVEHLRGIIDVETVPDDRAAFKAKHVKLRDIDDKRHLPNGVPRERFRSVTTRPNWYTWAGKDLWGGVQGDAWDV